MSDDKKTVKFSAEFNSDGTAKIDLNGTQMECGAMIAAPLVEGVLTALRTQIGYLTVAGDTEMDTVFDWGTVEGVYKESAMDYVDRMRKTAEESLEDARKEYQAAQVLKEVG